MRKSLTSDNKNLKIIDQSIIEINAINFSDITDYYRNGYVVFYNNNELSCCVVNTISIRYVEKKYTNGLNNNQLKLVVIELISKKNLLLILEKNFSQLNTQKAQ